MFDHLVSAAVCVLFVVAFSLTAIMTVGSFIHYCFTAGTRRSPK